MLNLVPPVTDNLSLLSAVASNDRSSMIADISGTLANAYRTYTDNSTTLHSVSPISLTEAQKSSLKESFKHPCKELRDLRNALFKSNPIRCQMCGISEVHPIDHYLPQDKFPEYCFLAINLIPVCDICNNRKSAKWLDRNNRRRTLNLYFDSVLTARFLFAVISFQSGFPFITYSLDVSGLSEEIRQVVINHFDELDLFDRYVNLFGESVSELVRMVKATGTTDKVRLKEIIVRDAEEIKNTLGLNSWKHITRLAMAENDDFLEYVLSDIK